MSWLKTAFLELFGLFVDDVPFTVGILAWLAVTVWALPSWTSPAVNAVLLFAGCALVYIGSVVITVRLKK